MKHDPRCESLSDEQVVADVKEYGWHVIKILDTDDTPGWVFSIGLYETFDHPEIVVFGLNDETALYVINAVGEAVRKGQRFEIDGLYSDLIETYSCTFKPVNSVWYHDFLGYANWFYGGEDYPVLQCIWPDRNQKFPWEPEFNANWVWAQPLLFHEEPNAARTVALLESMANE